MKKYFLVSVILLMFSVFVFPQAKQEYELMINGTTVANSSKKVAYLYDLSGSDLKLTTDSVSFKLIASGEIDLDRFIVTPGILYNDTFYATGSADTTTLTIDNAASVTTAVIEKAITTGSNDLEGVEVLKVSVEAAASGNDASDPNALYLYALRHYTLNVSKQKIN